MDEIPLARPGTVRRPGRRRFSSPQEGGLQVWAQQNPSPAQQNPSVAQHNPSPVQQNPNPSQRNPNRSSFRESWLLNGLSPISARLCGGYDTYVSGPLRSESSARAVNEPFFRSRPPILAFGKKNIGFPERTFVWQEGSKTAGANRASSPIASLGRGHGSLAAPALKLAFQPAAEFGLSLSPLRERVAEPPPRSHPKRPSLNQPALRWQERRAWRDSGPTAPDQSCPCR